MQQQTSKAVDKGVRLPQINLHPDGVPYGSNFQVTYRRDLAESERNACIGNCISNGCDEYDWFPKAGEEVNDDFWSYWLI